MDHAMDRPKDPAHGALAELATDVKDILDGYEKMIAKADGALRPVAERLHALHQTHLSDLERLLTEYGGHPDEIGSVMGTVHRAVVGARDWLDSLDGSAIGNVVDGEERLVQSYAAALNKLSGDARVRRVLKGQLDDLRAQIQALRD